jgi:uncharacterized RDD family membrane protein YckC
VTAVDAPQAIALGENASTTARFLAASVDLGWILGLAMASNAIFPSAPSAFFYLGIASASAIAAIVLGLLIVIAMTRVTGRTPGKFLLGLRIVHSKTGETIKTWQAALRGLLWFAAIALPVLLLWVFSDRQGRGLHDRLAQTRVVRA